MTLRPLVLLPPGAAIYVRDTPGFFEAFQAKCQRYSEIVEQHCGVHFGSEVIDWTDVNRQHTVGHSFFARLVAKHILAQHDFW